MSLVTDIAAILVNGSLSAAQKSAQVYALKSNALLAAATTAGLVGSPFTVGTLSVTVTAISVSNGRVVVSATAKRNNVNIVFPASAQPLIFVNPPVKHAGVENPLEALKQIVAAAVARYG